MVDFSNVARSNVTGKSVSEWIMPVNFDPAGKASAVLILHPATQSNAAYFNAMLKGNRRIASMARGGANAKMIDATRNDDRALYPKHIIIGWEGIFDASGQSVEFSKENCADLLKNLPDWVFDELREFCGNARNFLDTGDDSDSDTTDVVGN